MLLQMFVDAAHLQARRRAHARRLARRQECERMSRRVFAQTGVRRRVDVHVVRARVDSVYVRARSDAHGGCAHVPADVRGSRSIMHAQTDAHDRGASTSTVLVHGARRLQGVLGVLQTHTAIANRWSFTQYASGGLFRFVEYGFRSWKKLLDDDEVRANELLEQRDQRWEKEVGLFSKADCLHEDRKAAGLLA